LVIRYKKAILNKVVDMLSRPPSTIATILKHNSITYESCIKQYVEEKDFKEVYATLSHGKRTEELNYHIRDKILYHLGKLCIQESERVHVIREAHTSLIAGHFGVDKTIAQLQRFCYWPRMH
jgi:hypothetical protein